jgi:hypothetical protein
VRKEREFIMGHILLSTCFILFLLSISSNTIGSSNLTEICEEVGRRISPRGSETNEPWVQMNNPDFDKRLAATQTALSDSPIGALGEILDNLKAESKDYRSPKREEVAEEIYSKSSKMFKASKYFDFVPLGKGFNYTDLHMIRGRNIGQAYLSFPEVWIEVLSDKKYYLGLLDFSIETYNWVEKETKVEKGKNVLDDLIQYFEKYTQSHEQAVSMAWNMMGLYGSRGAAMNFITDHLSIPYGLKRVLIYFGYVISVMDALSEKGNLYTLPSSIETDCVIGKPYHFWMSAYLAYRLKQSEGWSKKRSMNVPFNLGKFYEYYSPTNGRTGVRTMGRHFLVHYKEGGPESMKNMSFRLGLALKGAGSFFGAHYPDETNTLEVEKLLSLSIEGSKKPLLFNVKSEAYTQPLRTINLDRIFGVQRLQDFLDELMKH